VVEKRRRIRIDVDARLSWISDVAGNRARRAVASRRARAAEVEGLSVTCIRRTGATQSRRVLIKQDSRAVVRLQEDLVKSG